MTTETVTTTTEGELSESETITGEETYTETTITTPDGEEIGNLAVIEGSETIVDTDPELPEEGKVEVELVPGEETKGEVSGQIITTEGKKPAELGKGEYDFTETTLNVDRVVHVKTEENEIKVEVEGTSELKPLIPDRSIIDDGDLKDEQLLLEYTYSGGFDDTVPVAAPEGGYDYRFTGFGQMSKFANAIVKANGDDGRTGALQFQVEYDPFFDPESDSNKEITEEDIFLTSILMVLIITGIVLTALRTPVTTTRRLRSISAPSR